MSSQILTEQPHAAATDAAAATWARLLRGHAGAVRQLSALLHAEHGLTINDYEALLHLSQADEHALRRVDLASALVLTASGVTRLLGGLEAAGYVARRSCDSDARVTYAVLTDAGEAKLREASRSHLAAIRALFGERYSSEELATLSNLLARLPGAAQPSSCAPGGS